MFVCVKKRIRFLDRLKLRKTKIETKTKPLGQSSVRAKSLQSCPTLCDPMDCSPAGSSVHGILQARILEWVAMPFSRGSFQPRDRIQVSCISRQILYHLSQQGNLPFVLLPDFYMHANLVTKTKL